MEKIGYRMINKNDNRGKPRKCANCGREGDMKVSFKDVWGKLVVTLCKDCAKKKYEELHLQTRLDWPIIA